MTIFFNDSFIQEDYLENSPEQFENSVKAFVKFSESIVKKRAEKNLKIHFKASSDIKEAFNEIGNVDLSDQMLNQLNVLGIKYWNPNSAQREDSTYYFFDTSSAPPVSTNISGKTLAEAAECKRLGNVALTLNLPDLRFSKHPHLLVDIQLKQNPSNVDRILIDCADCDESLEFWIEQQTEEKFKYSNFDRTPTDDETCLANKFKFEKVEGKKAQGRQIYIDKNGHYWYVDNLHKGHGAHIEVFNRNGKHLGESNLKGEINYSKSDGDKTLELK